MHHERQMSLYWQNMKLYNVSVWLPEGSNIKTEPVIAEILKTQSRVPGFFVTGGAKDASTDFITKFKYSTVLELDDYQIMLIKLNYSKCEIKEYSK